MNFNPPMCKAGKICIAEVEEVVDIDEIPPGQVNMQPINQLLIIKIDGLYTSIPHTKFINLQVHVPSIYVQKILHGQSYEKRIERVTISEPEKDAGYVLEISFSPINLSKFKSFINLKCIYIPILAFVDLQGKSACLRCGINAGKNCSSCRPRV